MCISAELDNLHFRRINKINCDKVFGLCIHTLMRSFSHHLVNVKKCSNTLETNVAISRWMGKVVWCYICILWLSTLKIVLCRPLISSNLRHMFSKWYVQQCFQFADHHHTHTEREKRRIITSCESKRRKRPRWLSYVHRKMLSNNKIKELTMFTLLPLFLFQWIWMGFRRDYWMCVAFVCYHLFWPSGGIQKNTIHNEQYTVKFGWKTTFNKSHSLFAGSERLTPFSVCAPASDFVFVGEMDNSILHDSQLDCLTCVSGHSVMAPNPWNKSSKNFLPSTINKKQPYNT